MSEPISTPQAPSDAEIQAALSTLKTEITEEALKKVEKLALEKAMLAAKLESDLRAQTEEVRRSFSEILPLEPFIVAAVEKRLATELNGAEIKDVSEYVAAYKRVLTEEAEKARAVVQQLRAAGKQEALTVAQEVVSNAPVEPQPKAEETPKQPEPDYFQQRLAEFRRTRGL